jgi:hypothetical protein
MKYILSLFIITLLLNSTATKAQFTFTLNPWGFNVTGVQNSSGHHFFDVDTSQSLDHVFNASSTTSSGYYLNFNKSSANSTPNFSNCINEDFLSYWQTTDSIYGTYIPTIGTVILGPTTKFFDVDNDGDQDMISSVINSDDTLNPDKTVSAYLSTGYTCLYNYDNSQLRYNLPFTVSNDTLAIYIFDIGHITKPSSKDIIALELGKPNKAQFVLYQDTSTSNSPS